MPPAPPRRRSRPPPAGAPPRTGRGPAALLALLERVENTDPQTARATVRRLLGEGSPVLPGFFERVEAYREVLPDAGKALFIKIEDAAVKARIGELPVAVLTDEARAGLEPLPEGGFPPARVVRLSAEGAVKQVVRHPDLTLDDYRRLPDVIEGGAVITEPSGRHLTLFLGDREGHHYKAAIKQTVNNEIFLTNFQRIHEKDVGRAKRRATRPPPRW